MDARAKQLEVNIEQFEPQVQLTELDGFALALVGGGCGEIVIG